VSDAVKLPSPLKKSRQDAASEPASGDLPCAPPRLPEEGREYYRECSTIFKQYDGAFQFAISPYWCLMLFQGAFIQMNAAYAYAVPA
jgi:hypothetical protein